MLNYRNIAATTVCIAALVSGTAAHAQERQFDVASQAASKSIPEFARQAGLQIIASADDLAGVVTPAISGRRDTREALRELIANTGLSIVSDNGSTIVLRKEQGQASGNDGTTADETAATIIVTGTRLGTTAQTPNPVATVAADDIIGRNGGISIGDQLSLLPQFRTTSTQAASTNVGTQAPGQVGLNLLDLRGLEPSRTLVLQDGRRLVSSTQALSQPDTNTIPVELLDRVEILTGGASAVYGADAIAGVVNFVLKKDYEGLALRAQAGISDAGDAGTQSIGLVAGKNFANGRGNVAISLEYARRDGLRYSDRTFANGQSDFVNNPNAAQPGQPRNIPVSDIRFLSFSPGGTVPVGPPFYRFASDGSLNPANTGRQAFLNLGISDGGDGTSSIANGSLLPDNERYAGSILANFEMSEAAKLFGQFDYVRATASGFGSPGTEFVFVSKTNPYLSAQALSVLNSYAPTAAGAAFPVLRDTSDFVVSREDNRRQTYRGVIGLEGSLSDHLRYELSYNYGRTDIRTRFDTYRPARFALAADAVRDTAGVLGTAGAIVCASRLANPTNTNPDIANCVPANIFGAGNISPAARDYITAEREANGRLTQTVIGGFLAGDTGGFFNLPGGPLSFVAGVEYRKETSRYQPDNVTGTTINPSPSGGSFDVKEAYAEIKLPVLADVAGAERLEFTASGRISDYNTRVGTKGTWGVGGLYQPIKDITFRASYSKAVRAPNIAELFQPTIDGFTQITDPCDNRFINNGTATRVANCAALGIPTTFQAGIPITIQTRTSGNPDLDVERGTTYTFGLSLTPSFLPRFAFSVDYYNITLRGAIANTNSSIINPFRVPSQCVDAPTIDNPFCALVQRDATTFNIIRVSQNPINLTRLEASGLDFDARYNVPIGEEAAIDFRTLASYVIDRNDFRSPFQPDFRTQIVETPSNPRFQLNFATNLTLGKFQLSHTLRYFSSVYYKNDDVAFFESVNGQPPLQPNRRGPEFIKTGDAFYHSLRGAFEIGEKSEFYVGVDNLADNKPPFSIYGSGFGGAQFDAIGRFFYAGVRASF
ncbi:TonB-dependent receptor [Sphingorhabdus contaminans]|uniref:TonB-dependent receptor n=1 Tax=Sphingorhabdus contaminans TaxID=1343899 RepID=UPI003D272FC5